MTRTIIHRLKYLNVAFTTIIPRNKLEFYFKIDL